MNFLSKMTLTQVVMSLIGFNLLTLLSILGMELSHISQIIPVTITLIIVMCALSVGILAYIKKAEEASELQRQTLINLENRVMIADHDDNLIYFNTASRDALTSLENIIRKEYPDFSAAGMEGASIHRMHKNPDRIREILNNLQPGQMHEGIINIGPLTLQLKVGAIHKDGKRLGAFAEWADISDKIRRDKEKTEIADQLRQSADSVNGAAGEIAEGNLNLSERTEAQAANIEETTATMQQITERVNESAQKAKRGIELANDTNTAANRGGEVVQNAIKAMEAISDSATRINDIIGVIDEIAFQTNLLALNAAVEAARAGEAGRGFAVVASEVRALAGRSADAAKEIKGLITESVERVQVGTKEVNDTGECLNDIISNVQQVSEMIQDIAFSSEEQASSIGEVNKAVTQMDSFTQQNAALVEEAAAASRSLQEQAESLMILVNSSES